MRMRERGREDGRWILGDTVERTTVPSTGGLHYFLIASAQFPFKHTITRINNHANDFARFGTFTANDT